MRYCGVLNLDKPAGVTSRDVVDCVVPLVHPAKAGHAGTLDPLATGVLVVCVGHATRLISLVQEGRKRYRGRFVLGQRSDTDDITGNVTPGGEWSCLSAHHLELLLPEFVGRILQTPPQFSAVHVEGRRAYTLARRGEVVELAARPVDVFSLRLTDFQPPEFEVEVECGGGTYIRSIGRDLGLRLGCGAVMTQLRRLAVGRFDVTDAVSPDKLTRETIAGVLQPALKIVSSLRQKQLTVEEMIAIRQGKSIGVRTPTDVPLAPALRGEGRGEGILPSCTSVPPIAGYTETIVADHRSTGALPIDVSQSTDRRTALLGVDGLLMGIAEYDGMSGRLHPRIVFPA